MSDRKCRRYSGVSDADLVRLAADGDGTSATARDALTELFCRYAPGLFAHCAKLYGRELNDKDEIMAFAGEVFLRFQKCAANFDPTKARCPAEIPKLIKCWLAKQAQWAIAAYRVEKENQAAARTDLDVERLPARTGRPPRSKQFLIHLRKLRTVLRHWPEKDRDILITSFRHRDPVTGKFHLPEDEQERLRTTWKFESNNSLLKYRTRRLQDLRTAMLANVA